MNSKTFKASPIPDCSHWFCPTKRRRQKAPQQFGHLTRKSRARVSGHLQQASTGDHRSPQTCSLMQRPGVRSILLGLSRLVQPSMQRRTLPGHLNILRPRARQWARTARAKGSARQVCVCHPHTQRGNMSPVVSRLGHPPRHHLAICSIPVRATRCTILTAAHPDIKFGWATCLRTALAQPSGTGFGTPWSVLARKCCGGTSPLSS